MTPQGHKIKEPIENIKYKSYLKITIFCVGQRKA